MKKFSLYVFLAFILIPVTANCDLLISSHNDTTSYTPLMQAASACDLSGVKRELDRDPTQVNQDDTDMGNATALHDAVAQNCLDVARYLIEHGAEVNADKKDGLTPLHLAARNGNLNIVILLLDHKAKINLVAKNGGTPLNSAESRHHEDVVDFLRLRGGVEGKIFPH